MKRNRLPQQMYVYSYPAHYILVNTLTYILFVLLPVCMICVLICTDMLGDNIEGKFTHIESYTTQSRWCVYVCTCV